MVFKQTEDTKLFIKQCDQLLRLGVYKTQKELAKGMGYGETSLAHILGGTRNVPKHVYANFCQLYSQIDIKDQNYIITQAQINELFKLLMLQAETINNLSKKK